MWSECVVIDPPFFDDLSGLRQVGEEVLVEALVAQSAIEALDEAVLGRLARCDVARPLDDYTRSHRMVTTY